MGPRLAPVCTALLLYRPSGSLLTCLPWSLSTLLPLLGSARLSLFGEPFSDDDGEDGDENDGEEGDKDGGEDGGEDGDGDSSGSEETAVAWSSRGPLGDELVSLTRREGLPCPGLRVRRKQGPTVPPVVL